MFSVSSRNKDKEMFMTGSQEVVGSIPIFSISQEVNKPTEKTIAAKRKNFFIGIDLVRFIL